MKDPRDQEVAFVAVVDDVALDRKGPNAFAEFRPEATHPRLFGQQFESVDEGVDESVRRGGAGVLGDEDQISSRSCSAREDSR
jgi:hypothetical protein